MFADFFVILFAAHLLSDYPFQTDHQAQHKAGCGAAGWRANAAHATTHLAVSLVLVWLIGQTLLSLPVSAVGMAAALAWVTITHAVIDRRWPVARWMAWARQAGFAQHGGAAHVDQTFHIALGLLPAAVMLATL